MPLLNRSPAKQGGNPGSKPGHGPVHIYFSRVHRSGVVPFPHPEHAETHGCERCTQTVEVLFKLLFPPFLGFYFRVQRVDHPVAVKGFQAEVDRTPKTGGLYETLGRAWVAKPDGARMREAYRGGEWASMEVRCRGGNITVRVNGLVTADLKDDPSGRKGHFGFQLHGNQDMDVEFKDAQIRVLK